MLLKGAFKQSGDSPNHEANKYVFTMFFIIHPVTKLPHKTCDTTTNWEELNQKPLHDLSWQWFLYLFLCICRISITQVTSRLWIHRITSMFIGGLAKNLFLLIYTVEICKYLQSELAFTIQLPTYLTNIVCKNKWVPVLIVWGSTPHLHLLNSDRV